VTKPPTPPEIPEEDVQELLERAALLQAEARKRAVEDGTASIEEVQAVARELDIAPEHVEAAMRSLREERQKERRRREEEERAGALAAARRSAGWRWAGWMGGGALLFGGACMGVYGLLRGCSALVSEAPAPEATATLSPETPRDAAPERAPASAPPAAPLPKSDPEELPAEPEAAGAAAPVEAPAEGAPVAEEQAPKDTPAGTPRRVKLAAGKAQLLQRELEGAWELQAYLLRDEGRWVGVPVTRTLERWKFRRAGDFEHVMGGALTFSGRWKVQEGVEGFPLPWSGAEAFLLALEDVVGLSGDLSRYKDWHVGVLQDGELALFYAGRGEQPNFGSVTQGHRFARSAR
jgi:hypothetical protein